ncbi:MAG: hypothetical protein J2P17_11925 [Mycobacterium sp.]|nr:hypothetical protein [Mycobacterium sp.]
MVIGALKGAVCGVAARLGPAVLSWLPRRSGRHRRVPMGVLGGAALLSLSGLPFSLAATTGSAGVATSNSAAGQPTQWVSEAYTAPAAIPVDGDGHPRPAPPAPSARLSGCKLIPHHHDSVSNVCGTGTGQQRLTAQCIPPDGGWGAPSAQRKPARPRSVAGNWAGRGQLSTINCDGDDFTKLNTEYRG